MKPTLPWILYGAGATLTSCALLISTGLAGGIGAAGAFLLFAALCASPDKKERCPDREAARPPAVVRPSGSQWRQP